METLSLSVILLRVNKETAISSHQPFLNLNPSFQRKYEALTIFKNYFTPFNISNAYYSV